MNRDRAGRPLVTLKAPTPIERAAEKRIAELEERLKAMEAEVTRLRRRAGLPPPSYRGPM